jgi:YbbR domain-containing protein
VSYELKMRFLMDVLRKYLLNQVRLKILALFLAIMTWFSMTYLGESEMAFSVPLSFENLGKAMIMREADTKDILITVNGPLSILKNIRAEDIRVPLDLSRARDGRQILTIRKGDVVVPNGVKIEGVRPDYVVVEVDKIVEKQLRTVVKLGDKWLGIYQVAFWYPQHVYVEGPKEVLDKRDSLDTFPVDGDFKQQQEVLDAPLNTKPLEARKVRPDTVRVVLRKIEK